jgi:hypothetical protein
MTTGSCPIVRAQASKLGGENPGLILFEKKKTLFRQSDEAEIHLAVFVFVVKTGYGITSRAQALEHIDNATLFRRNGNR